METFSFLHCVTDVYSQNPLARTTIKKGRDLRISFPEKSENFISRLGKFQRKMASSGTRGQGRPRPELNLASVA